MEDSPIESPQVSDTKECPMCAETIKAQAKICRFCGFDLVAGNQTNTRDAYAMNSQVQPKTDVVAYKSMAELVMNSVQQLFQPFRSFMEPRRALTDKHLEAFLLDFLEHADKFAQECSIGFADVVRQHSIVPEIRGMPTNILSKEIRSVAFESLDGILRDYVDALRSAAIDFGYLEKELQSTGVLSSALVGAALGQAAGGFGEDGKTLGMFSGFVAAASAVVKRSEIQEQQIAMARDAKALAYAKITEYLEQARDLPDVLMDVGCAKCFGAEVDLALQKKALLEFKIQYERELHDRDAQLRDFEGQVRSIGAPQLAFKLSAPGPQVEVINGTLYVKRGTFEHGVGLEDVEVALTDIENIELKRGLLTNTLTIKTKNGVGRVANNKNGMGKLGAQPFGEISVAKNAKEMENVEALLVLIRANQ